MIQSPCRNCPNRYKDKSLCMETCVLLHRVQAFHAGRREPPIYTAVNYTDDNRYRLATTHDLHHPATDSPALY